MRRVSREAPRTTVEAVVAPGGLGQHRRVVARVVQVGVALAPILPQTPEMLTAPMEETPRIMEVEVVDHIIIRLGVMYLAVLVIRVL